ncbi:MAG TPA: YggS family pyridoxal phosphate-dependent enzyme [Candidatus Pseudogracilibacillus intestinigallinarum]|uniref:Pyridoxal phosphate homeostasis protein n=1 Tax=Candidatus Pseudogracilibacillus intestinigallinarum TaxID=2838742 RepID=A0A9D1PLJ0_9BACI|nr:YggS family pyridoxal phosphate-dependent enzyme [Candidatus Pseudogracilibacillus intestinigallinarum]
MDVANNVKQIEEEIVRACEKVQRNRNEITIIGVTKYVTIERTEQLLATGYKDVGENRAEEMLHKYGAIGERAKWHFIGTLQSRKVKDIVDKVTAIHSLDRLSVAKQINSRSNNPIDCFVQVNVSGEESKHGLEPEEVIPFIESLQQFEKVHVVGLMTMAPHIQDKEEIRQVFRRLRQLRDEVSEKKYINAPCTQLSMGMSNDFQIAIEEGATHIRLGTSLVGS